MGFFSTIFSKNRRKWLGQLSDKNVEKKFSIIVVQFFIIDNLDFDQYIENQSALFVVHEFGSLEFLEELNEVSIEREAIPKPSKTFKKYYCDKLNFPLGILKDDWFYIGYPDVAKWISENSNNFEDITEMYKNVFFDTEDNPTLEFYRFFIDKYKTVVGGLELGFKKK